VKRYEGIVECIKDVRCDQPANQNDQAGENKIPHILANLGISMRNQRLPVSAFYINRGRFERQDIFAPFAWSEVDEAIPIVIRQLS
jgi:hypothetical protein